MPARCGGRTPSGGATSGARIRRTASLAASPLTAVQGQDQLDLVNLGDAGAGWVRVVDHGAGFRVEDDDVPEGSAR